MYCIPDICIIYLYYIYDICTIFGQLSCHWINVLSLDTCLVVGCVYSSWVLLWVNAGPGPGPLGRPAGPRPGPLAMVGNFFKKRVPGKVACPVY